MKTATAPLPPLRSVKVLDQLRTHPTLRSSPCRRTRAHTPERFSLSCLKTLVILRLGVPAVNSRARKTGAGPARAPSATSATCDRSAFIRLRRIPPPPENAACMSYPSGIPRDPHRTDSGQTVDRSLARQGRRHCGLNLRPPPTYRLRSTFGDLRYGSRRGAVNCQPRSKRHSRKLAQHRAPLAKSVERAARTFIRRCMAMHPRPVPAPNALGVA